ncbi:hypothetical protein [Methylobacterium brachythecii]|uniref:hypothetical protein n=1 Tax=Methylobacterium brachythecii TaxID=1176177 RepID=UPI0016135F09|nr:hypothetical protein [Methylobacterium brachythecii]
MSASRRPLFEFFLSVSVLVQRILNTTTITWLGPWDSPQNIWLHHPKNLNFIIGIGGWLLSIEAAGTDRTYSQVAGAAGCSRAA